MAESEGNLGNSHAGVHLNGYQRDLFQKFIFGNHLCRNFDGEGEEGGGEIELSLGLSTNGRFGVDPTRVQKLVRSSSIANFPICGGDERKARDVADSSHAPISRTCSLPTETEEWRKRKVLQSLRRMEAKRRRFEKLKNGSTGRDRVESEENLEENGEITTANGVAGAGGRVGNGHGFELNGYGSIGSQGSGSSGISDLENQPVQGTNNNSEPAKTSVGMESEKPAAKTTVANKEVKQMQKNMIADMPFVFTKGDGPNGKRIEGFLYRYKKGEEVRIVCVCHGSFLSPAEFVMHAGGGSADVENPLRHIIINPTSFLL